MTTRQPDDDQIEVAVAAMNAALYADRDQSASGYGRRRAQPGAAVVDVGVGVGVGDADAGCVRTVTDFRMTRLSDLSQSVRVNL